MWVPKVLLTPIIIWIFGPKRAKFGPIYAFLVILGQILAFLAHFIPCPAKKQGAKVFFSVMWVPKEGGRVRAKMGLCKGGGV